MNKIKRRWSVLQRERSFLSPTELGAQRATHRNRLNGRRGAGVRQRVLLGRHSSFEIGVTVGPQNEALARVKARQTRHEGEKYLLNTIHPSLHTLLPR
jgi:hypothetical protein